MASRPISPEQMLAAIPSLPRPMLARLVDHMIDRLGELDGDADDRDNSNAVRPSRKLRLLPSNHAL